ncbi:MAG: NAD(P)-dependent oxidoreductase [Acidimicrobiales bacterium]
MDDGVPSDWTQWRTGAPIRWSNGDAGSGDLRNAARQFLRDAGDSPWVVVWCAGSGTTNSPLTKLQDEVMALRSTLDELSRATAGRRGMFFFASSAGGVYSGVGAPPYDEFSPVLPLTDYGRAKLEGEELVTEWSHRVGIPSLIGRIANLYGPGQDFNKPQGLISQICRSYLLGTPVSIYVSLDTLRDYIFAPDCASLIIEGLVRLAKEDLNADPLVVTKIFASQHAITIGAVLGELRRILKSPPRIVVATSEVSQTQVRDLSLRSVVWPELDRRVNTPFPVGVAMTVSDLRRRLQAAEL